MIVAAIGFSILALGTVLGMVARRKAPAAVPGTSIGGVLVVNPVQPTQPSDPATPHGQLPPSIIGVPEAPPETPATPYPGQTADNPTDQPSHGTFYWVKEGDTGTAIAGKAYSIPTSIVGGRLRAWEAVRKHPQNRALSKSGLNTWSGDLYHKHKAPGQHPSGSGTKFPVVWFPPADQVSW